MHYILTEDEKEKKITRTVNINTQDHPTIPVTPSDTSTRNFKRSHITQLRDTKTTTSTPPLTHTHQTASSNTYTCTGTC